MINSLKILPVENNDIEALAALVNSAYRGESSKKGWTTEADLLGGVRTSQQSLKDLIQLPGSTLLAAKNDSNQLVGCVFLQQQGKQLYLGMLTVAPDIQAKGIGSQLLLTAEKHAKDNDCNTISMTVIDVRYELIDWYIRKGYYKTGETKPFPNDPAFGIPRQPLQFTVLEKVI